MTEERTIPEGVRIYKPARAEERAINKRLRLKPNRKPIAGSRCAACPKILEESEVSIRGYASGEELELCRKCASTVNTRQAIEAAEHGGHVVHSKPIIHAGGSPPRVALDEPS
jgi:hypothetical protein